MNGETCACGSELAYHHEQGPWDWSGWVCDTCDRIPEKCSCPVFCKTCFRPLGHNDPNPCDLHATQPIP